MTDTDKHYCKFCHEEIIWGKDANGKPSPRNTDGSLHKCMKKEEYREVPVKGSEKLHPASQEPPGATGAQPPVLKEKETPIQSSMNEAAKGDYVSVRERLIVYQTVYKALVTDVIDMMPYPERDDDTGEYAMIYNTVMDMVLERVKKDAKELISCASRP